MRATLATKWLSKLQTKGNLQLYVLAGLLPKKPQLRGSFLGLNFIILVLNCLQRQWLQLGKMKFLLALLGLEP